MRTGGRTRSVCTGEFVEKPMWWRAQTLLMLLSVKKIELAKFLLKSTTNVASGKLWRGESKLRRLKGIVVLQLIDAQKGRGFRPRVETAASNPSCSHDFKRGKEDLITYGPLIMKNWDPYWREGIAELRRVDIQKISGWRNWKCSKGVGTS